MNNGRSSGAADLQGTVVARSDVQGYPDVGIDTGLILVIDEKEVGRLTEFATEPDTTIDGVPVFMSQAVKVLVRGRASLGKGGVFKVSLPAGNYRLLACNLGNSHPNPTYFPAMVYGSISITLKSGVNTVDLFYDGEARRLGRE